MAPAKRIRTAKKPFEFFVEHFQAQAGAQGVPRDVALDECTRAWKSLKAEHKQMFENMAKEDEARCQRDLEKTKPVARATTKKGKKKDPNAPKRGLTAFFCFSNEQRPIVKAKNPEYGVGEVAKELGRQWTAMDENSKAKYRAMAEADKERYEREVKEYTKHNE